MPFDPANLTTLAARHQRLMQIRYGHESHGLTTEQKLQKILHYCAVELDVARAGLWRLNSAGDAITCIMQYERGAHHFSCGAEFHASDYPRYFAAIRNDCIFKSDAARTDYCTEGRESVGIKPRYIPANPAPAAVTRNVASGLVNFQIRPAAKLASIVARLASAW